MHDGIYTDRQVVVQLCSAYYLLCKLLLELVSALNLLWPFSKAIITASCTTLKVLHAAGDTSLLQLLDTLLPPSMISSGPPLHP